MLIKHKNVSELTDKEIIEIQKKIEEIRRKDKIKQYWKGYMKDRKWKFKEKLRPPSLF